MNLAPSAVISRALVIIRVPCLLAQDGTEVFFKIKRKSALKKLMDVYEQRQGIVIQGTLRFIFDGNRLVETHTPDDVSGIWSVGL